MKFTQVLVLAASCLAIESSWAAPQSQNDVMRTMALDPQFRASIVRQIKADSAR